MIGDRYAVGVRAGALGGSKVRARRTWTLVPPWRGRALGSVAAVPLAAGRERLAALRQSVLVQLMLAMTFMALAALLYLAQASQVSVLQFSIADLQNQRTQLTVQNATLRTTATKLQSVRRIAQSASNQLHMTKPDISTSVWVWPVVPPAAAVQSMSADTAAAREESQPAAWMRRLLTLVESAL